MDGIYCDATHHAKKRPSAIAVVLVCDGKMKAAHGKMVQAKSSGSAEKHAVEWAKELYPDGPYFTDSAGTASKCGITWVPRKQHGHAHRFAAKTYREYLKSLPNEEIDLSNADFAKGIGSGYNNPHAILGKKGRKGRGVIPLGTVSRFVQFWAAHS